MKITLARDDLAPALDALARIVETRNTIPILSNIALVAEGEALRMTASDLDLEVRVRVPASVGEPGATTIHARRLHDIVGKLSKGTDLEIETTTDAATARVRCGRSRFDLQVLPIADFPEFPWPMPLAGFDLPAETLAEMFEATHFAISTEETRYYLNGVFLHAPEGNLGPVLTAVATDGHRLARWRRPAPAGAEAMPGVIVPRKTVGELMRLAKGGTAPVRIEVSAEKIRATFGGDTAIVLTSKLIDGTFPDYGRVIPTSSGAAVTVDRAALAASLDRATAIQTDRGSAVKCAFAEGRLTISSRNPDAGSAEEEMAYDDIVDAGTDPADIAIGFNGRYLRDALQTLTGDRVEIGLTDPGSPATFRPHDQPATAADRLVVVMPMRV